MSPVFRFAPSPNGLLHLGHAYSALFTAEAAKAVGGTMLLRIEDIDTTRCKPEFDTAILEDLMWLGLRWPEPVMRQSARFSVYGEAAKKLPLYPCFCSRREIAEKSTGRDPEGAPLYPGTCRSLPKDRVAELLAAEAPVQWRLDMPAGRQSGRLEITEYPVAGNAPLFDRPTLREAHPERWGDVVIVRKETPTSYHLSVVVDDAAQGVTHVTRGMDLYHATDVHVLLQRLLGLPSPHYAHHGLITDAADEKLSKSAGSTPLRQLRDNGLTPKKVRQRLGFPPA